MTMICINFFVTTNIKIGQVVREELRLQKPAFSYIKIFPTVWLELAVCYVFRQRSGRPALGRAARPGGVDGERF